MEAKPVHLVVDSREEVSGIPSILKVIPGVTVESRQLECGDYLVAPGVVVERKSNHDFAASIMDGRMFGQLELMRANYSLVVLLVEGDVHRTSSGIKDEALHGALSYLAVLSHVRLIYSRDQRDSAQLIHTFGRHLAHGLGYEVPMRVSKPKQMDLLRQYLVEGLPGVGPGRAQALLAHFGGVKPLLTATVGELAAAPGIGPKTAQRISEVLSS